MMQKYKSKILKVNGYERQLVIESSQLKPINVYYQAYEWADTINEVSSKEKNEIIGEISICFVNNYEVVESGAGFEQPIEKSSHVKATVNICQRT